MLWWIWQGTRTKRWEQWKMRWSGKNRFTRFINNWSLLIMPFWQIARNWLQLIFWLYFVSAFVPLRIFLQHIFLGAPWLPSVKFSITPPPTSTPPLVMVNWIAVKVDCKGWWNLQSVMKLFTVGGKTYICRHRTVPVSFMTDCKKFRIRL